MNYRKHHATDLLVKAVVGSHLYTLVYNTIVFLGSNNEFNIAYGKDDTKTYFIGNQRLGKKFMWHSDIFKVTLPYIPAKDGGWYIWRLIFEDGLLPFSENNLIFFFVLQRKQFFCFRGQSSLQLEKE